MSNIRVGMVRCDGHAYTFGPLIDKCDTKAFREFFFNEYFWMIDCCRPEKLRTELIEGFSVVKVFDTDRSRDVAHTFRDREDNAADLSRFFFGKPQVCTELAQMTEDIDAAIISCCNGNGEMHLELAKPFLEKGIPIFIDKPLASTYKDAKAIAELAVKYDTPFFSSSILGYVDEVEFLKSRFRELEGPVNFGVIKGVGGKNVENLGAIIHGIALAQAVFGPGAEWVETMGANPMEHMLIGYSSGAEALVVNSPLAFDGFRCDVYSKQGHNPPLNGKLSTRAIGDWQFIPGALKIMKLFKTMVETRKPPVPYEHMLEQIAIIEAGRLAGKKRCRVYLNEI